MQKLRAQLVARGQLTVPELTRVRRLFGGDPGTLGEALIAEASGSDHTSSAMLGALTIEESKLEEALAVVRRVSASVPLLTAAQIHRLSLRQRLRLYAALCREEQETMLLALGAFCETNPPMAARPLKPRPQRGDAPA